MEPPSKTPPLSLRGPHQAEADGNLQATLWVLADASLTLPTSLCPVATSWPPGTFCCLHVPYTCLWHLSLSEGSYWRTIGQCPSRRQVRLQVLMSIKTSTCVSTLGLGKNVYHSTIRDRKKIGNSPKVHQKESG